jgi:hypothetical protein
LNHLRVITLPCSEIERRPACVESEISTDDVRDGFRFDFALGSFVLVVNVEMEQCVSVLVD